MSLAAHAIAPIEPPPDEDRLVVVNGVEWKTYCALRELLDSPGVRLTYLKGALEIRTTSRRHEFYKKTIARLFVTSLRTGVPGSP
jgi:hypothetical protein